MSKARSPYPPRRRSTFAWSAFSVACFAIAAIFTSTWILLVLLLGTVAGAAALRHLLRPRRGSALRVDLQAGLVHLVMLTIYAAIAAILIGFPLHWLRDGATLGAVLAISAAVVLTLFTLWRVWPAFGFVSIHAAFATHSLRHRSLMADAVTRAWRLTSDNEVFFSHGLLAAMALLLQVQGALSLAGITAPVAHPYRIPALISYALLTLVASGSIMRSSVQVLRLDLRRAHAGPAPPEASVAQDVVIEPEQFGIASQLNPSDLNAMLLRCVRAGQTQLALDALAHGADPDALPSPEDRDQRSALILAVLNPDMRLLRGFIARGADLQKVHAGLPVLIAATRDSNEGRAEAVMTLLTNGANVQLADAQGNKPLHYAVLSERPIVAALLCDAGAPLDAVNAAGQSPLAVACEAANWELAKFLLERGARPELPHAQPAILAAAAVADDDAQGVKLLLKRRARVDARDALGRTALMTAALNGHVEIAEALLAAGAQVDAVDANGTTALIEAARAGALEVIDALAAYRPDPDHADNAGRTALIVASLSARADEATVRRLLALGVSRQIAAKDARRAVDHAAAAGRWNIVALLDADYVRPVTVAEAASADVQAATDTTEHLLDALRFGHWHIVEQFAASMRGRPQTDLAQLYMELASLPDGAACRWLLNHGLEANGTLPDGTSLLHRLLDGMPATLPALTHLLDAGAQATGATALPRIGQALCQADAPLGALEALALRVVAAGADMFAADADGRTPLMRAAHAGRVELVATLLAHGVDPQARDRKGRTALFAALAAPSPVVPALIKQLLRAGADPDTRAANNETVLGLALAQSQTDIPHWLNWPLWRLPRRALRDADLVAAAGVGDLDAVRKLLELGLPVDAQDQFGATALLHAAGQGHVGLVDYLIERGANTQHAALTGATALGAAVTAGHRHVLERLLARGIDVDQRQGSNATALMLAAGRGNFDFVDLLLQRGASAQAADAHDMRALHLAARHAFGSADGAGVHAICTALLDAGAAIDARNGDGQTALLVLLGAQFPPRAVADQRALSQVAGLLLQRGAGVDAQDDRGVGPLHACAMHGLLLPLRVLLAAGADPSRTDLLGRTPAEVAHLLGFVDVATELEAAHIRRRVV